MGVGFAPSERAEELPRFSGRHPELMPAMSAGVVDFLLHFRPTCRVPKKVGPGS